MQAWNSEWPAAQSGPPYRWYHNFRHNLNNKAAGRYVWNTAPPYSVTCVSTVLAQVTHDVILPVGSLPSLDRLRVFCFLVPSIEWRPGPWWFYLAWLLASLWVSAGCCSFVLTLENNGGCLCSFHVWPVDRVRKHFYSICNTSKCPRIEIQPVLVACCPFFPKC